MVPSTLFIYMTLNNLNANRLAKAAGLTRQAISKWFTSNQNLIKADWQSVIKISKVLNVQPSKLLEDPFEALDRKKRKEIEILLLWDHLFDSLESFIVAMMQKDPRAVARYIHVFGILNAEKIWGKWVFKKFSDYAVYIHPARRKELSALCMKLQDLKLV
jgi:transcriptional regulator with XRE-family HTH domain